MTRVKICGITNIEDALKAQFLGADELGFNFYENSPRYIAPDMAAEIIAGLSSEIAKVGVFVNASAESILEIVAIAGLDSIQIHGDEEPGFVRHLRSLTDKLIIKAIRAKPDLEVDDAVKFDANAILIDSYFAEEYGGSGRTFDWEIAGAIAGLVERVYLAGGLTPENVSEAIQTVNPYAVDVASGVESSPGKKDPARVEEFIRAVKTTAFSN